MKPHPAIERHFGLGVPCPVICGIGLSRQTVARPGLDPHAHDMYEICLLDREVHWFVESASVTVPPGSIFFTRPDQLHGHRQGIVEPCELRWLQVDPTGDPALAGLLTQLAGSGTCTWTGDPRLDAWHEAMLDECRRPQPDSPSMMAWLLQLFLGVALRAQRQSRRPPMHRAVARAIALMESDVERRWTLDDLQTAANVSRTRLQQLFERDVGISPVAYAMRLRLRRAEQWLRETARPITRIALDLGFSSSQHFATVFRQQYGMTPTAYRRSPQM